MNDLEQAKARAMATYNAAADHFDHPANTFWDRFGRTTIEALDLQPGQTVLDVCCGTGASAIPAAHQVGPEGRVLGVDLAENLLQLATTKATRAGLTNIEFRAGDFLSLGLADHDFDAVVCVFGIFFVPDMPGAVRELWRLVRPGGRLALTTWGPNFFEPANSVFWNAIQQEAPELHKSFNPWDRISDPDLLRVMLWEAGIEACDITAEAGVHPITSPDAWWTTLLGSGYRGTLDQLSIGARARVREASLQFIRESHITAVEANVLYAVATKPLPG
ncbi:methyltransferase domain-containing protein [Methylocaldum sp. BRCS4]|jgi:ubiquinone/menaquinone biosynthesis C-methylase UbiE|uniref:class I SAM-dependent methyltransferase n=1 Tax=Methylocaldum sp. 14B TaxID=1912213 RepID=UPI00098B0C2C|nr:methyltransferase domain-containing protein [Methylocaldum sp. 14B]MVF23713.1 methyltransferase domain-containing protein [Methylocaldum sp. BRCS4]